MGTFEQENKSDRRRPRGSNKRSGSNRTKSFNQSEGRGPSRFDRRDSKRSSRMGMHKAICDKCGKECEVPFKPTPNKPIYCNDCFRKEDSRSKNISSNGLEEINRKLDKIMEALEIK